MATPLLRQASLTDVASHLLISHPADPAAEVPSSGQLQRAASMLLSPAVKGLDTTPHPPSSSAPPEDLEQQHERALSTSGAPSQKPEVLQLVQPRDSRAVTYLSFFLAGVVVGMHVQFAVPWLVAFMTREVG